MMKYKTIIGFSFVGLALAIGYFYWIADFDFDASDLSHRDGKALMIDAFEFALPRETVTVQEKIKSGFGNDYSVDALYLVPEKSSIITSADCQKYGLSKGGTVGEVLVAEKMNITLIDKSMVLEKMGGQSSTCYRRKLVVQDGEIRISLIVIAGKYVLFLDAHT